MSHSNAVAVVVGGELASLGRCEQRSNLDSLFAAVLLEFTLKRSACFASAARRRNSHTCDLTRGSRQARAPGATRHCSGWVRAKRLGCNWVGPASAHFLGLRSSGPRVRNPVYDTVWIYSSCYERPTERHRVATPKSLARDAIGACPWAYRGHGLRSAISRAAWRRLAVGNHDRAAFTAAGDRRNAPAGSCHGGGIG